MKWKTQERRAAMEQSSRKETVTEIPIGEVGKAERRVSEALDEVANELQIQFMHATMISLRPFDIIGVLRRVAQKLRQ